MSFLDRLNWNSRERVTSTDLERLQTLMGADVLNALMYFLSDKHTGTTVAGLYDGVLGGLKPSVSSVLPAVVGIEAGYFMQYDTTGAVTPLGENSPYRLGKVATAFTVPVPAPAVATWYVIQVRHALTTSETQNRDVWNNLLSIFFPSNVAKRYTPSYTYGIVAGTAGGGVPAYTAGWTPTAHVQTSAAAGILQLKDARPLLAPRTLGHGQTGVTNQASISNYVALANSGIENEFLKELLGAIDLLSDRAVVFQATDSGFLLRAPYPPYSVIASLKVDAATNYARFQLKDDTFVRWLDAKQRIFELIGAHLKLTDGGGLTRGALSFYDHNTYPPGDPRITGSSGYLGLGGTIYGSGLAGDQPVEIKGSYRRIEILPDGVGKGYAIRDAAGNVVGGILTGSGDGEACVAYRFLSLGATPRGSVVRVVLGAGSSVEVSNKGIIHVCNAYPSQNVQNPPANLYDGDIGLIMGKVDGIALNATAGPNETVWVCTHGRCQALLDASAAAVSGYDLHLSITDNGHFGHIVLGDSDAFGGVAFGDRPAGTNPVHRDTVLMGAVATALTSRDAGTHLGLVHFFGSGRINVL